MDRLGETINQYSKARKNTQRRVLFLALRFWGVQLIEVHPLLMKPGAATISANFVQLTAPAVHFVSLHYVRHADWKSMNCHALSGKSCAIVRYWRKMRFGFASWFSYNNMLLKNAYQKSYHKL
ncbi:MAG: hypothetical protein J6K55_02095 [Clostridia bacterium]|nr:hypothetical protein [Clostridia bacterium]